MEKANQPVLHSSYRRFHIGVNQKTLFQAQLEAWDNGAILRQPKTLDEIEELEGKMGKINECLLLQCFSSGSEALICYTIVLKITEKDNLFMGVQGHISKYSFYFLQ